MAAPGIAYSTLQTPADGYVVERDLGVVFGTAMGTNYSVTFSVTKAMQKEAQAIEQTRVAAMNNMGQQAASRGANIVLGVAFDMERVQGIAIVTCWGTACVVKANSSVTVRAPVVRTSNG
eukprot:scpid102523/ scgid0356/ 